MNINKELFYSITANNFSRLLSLLPYHFESIHELREYITREKIHFVRDFPVYFNKTKADVMITYDWRTGPIGLQKAIWSGFDYIGLHISESYPGVDVERIICDEISFWVDFLFIDQNKRNVEAELGELPKIIDSSSIHFV